MFHPARRLSGIEVSASAAITDKARELRAAGTAIIGLSSGEPDFPTPDHAIAAAHAAALAGDTKYPPQEGTVALRRAIQRKFARENGLSYALDEILTGNGAKQLIFDAMMASCDPGDEVIIPTPGWISYADIAKAAGGVPVPVACPERGGFTLRAEDLEAAITGRTRWLVLNFPNNPTGALCDVARLREIAAVLARHPRVLVLSDDIYEHLLYDGAEFHTIAAVAPELRERVLTVNGLSKAYAMTGWRVGYCGGPRSLIAAMNMVQLQATGGICTLAQAAAVAALEGPQDYLAERAAIYRERRDLVLAMLAEAPGLRCHRPAGAFYLFPNIEGCLGKTSPGGVRIETDVDFVRALLGEAHVAAVQGAAYGMSPYFRLSYATDLASLTAGCERIAAFCASLR